jgi:hypothetical protein
MMSSSTRKKTFAFIFIALTLAIPFGMIYYVSTDYYKERYQKWRRDSDQAGRAIHSSIKADQIVLTKNEKLVVKRTCLVFKGLDKKIILLDLYLLDLDPEQPYPVRIAKRDAKKEMRIGGNRFKLISVNNRYLSLKLLGSPQVQ